LGTFLAAEKNGTLYLIDQHAAHERILYDELMEGAQARQELLVPMLLETASDAESERVRAMAGRLEDIGFALSDAGDGNWELTAHPARWKGTARDLADDILAPGIEATGLVSRIYATAACRAACKDGDVLDPATGRDLVARAFALKEPLCPHGRPVWVALGRDELFKRIRRT
jgi:DNA mismatch repair protein MutL